MDTRRVFLLVFCTFLLMFTWFHALVQASLGDIHTSCVAFVADLCWFAGALAALPTCFVEGISVGVAGRLLGRFCRVHTGIRFNTIHRQRNTEIKTLRFGKSSRLYSSHVLRLPPCPSIPPTGFLSFRRPLGLFGVSGRLASFLSIVPGPTSLSAAVRQGLSTSLPLLVPPLPLARSLSLSLFSISQTLSICC